MTRLTMRRRCLRLLGTLAFLALAGVCGALHPVAAQDCSAIIPLLQEGRSSVEIARMTGIPSTAVDACRRRMQNPPGYGPAGRPPVRAAGAPPVGAAGAPPVGAAGQPPVGAAGRPPLGAAGQAPSGAAGRPPSGAAGAPPISRDSWP